MSDDRITLVGGPGDGMTLRWESGDRLEWRPVNDAERIMARTMGRPHKEGDPITYKRSTRTRSLFVYQP